MIRIHAIVLMVCSMIGFTGHYLQFGVARLTPWIPATAGLLILLLDIWCRDREDWLKYLPLLGVLAFGILTTNMDLRFLHQDFQPLRKKIIFSMMSLSAWITVIHYLADRRKADGWGTG